MTDEPTIPGPPERGDEGAAAPASPAAGALPSAAPESEAAPFRAPFPEVLPASAALVRISSPIPPAGAHPPAALDSAAPAGPDSSGAMRVEQPAPSVPPSREAREEAPPPPARDATSARGRREGTRPPRGPRPDLVLSSEPLYRDAAGYRMRLEPPDLARLRELPGSKGKSDQELGETFFDGQAARFTASLAEDVPAPADVRVVVDPYSRQAFLAVEKKIRSILSF